jgi:hypothetical protein
MKKVILCLTLSAMLISCSGSTNDEGQQSGKDSTVVQSDSLQCKSDSLKTTITNSTTADTTKVVK